MLIDVVGRSARADECCSHLQTDVLSYPCIEIEAVQTESLLETIMHHLKETPGQSVIELASKLNVNRIFLAGYLKALEEQGQVSYRKVGPARLYYEKEMLQT